MSVGSVPDPNSIIFHNYGKKRHCKSGCAVSGKTYDKQNNGHAGKSKTSGGKVKDTMKKWCSLHKTTSHNDAACYQQGTSRLKQGGVSSATALGVHSLPSENDEKPAINFDDDFDGGFQC